MVVLTDLLLDFQAFVFGFLIMPGLENEIDFLPAQWALELIIGMVVQPNETLATKRMPTSYGGHEFFFLAQAYAALVVVKSLSISAHC